MVNIGADYSDGKKYEFVVWAPFLKKVELKIVSPKKSIVPMVKDGKGYWRTTVEDPGRELLYCYRLDDKKDRPDPQASLLSDPGEDKSLP